MQTGSTIVLKPNLPGPRLVAPMTSAGALADRPFAPGTQLDRYLILERIGGGGTGQVYRARDTELDREVALKVLARRTPRQPDDLNRVRAGMLVGLGACIALATAKLAIMGPRKQKQRGDCADEGKEHVGLRVP